MNLRTYSRLAALLLAFALPLVLVACGNKGPLVLPSQSPSTPVESAPAAAPATDAPTDASVDASEPPPRRDR